MLLVAIGLFMVVFLPVVYDDDDNYIELYRVIDGVIDDVVQYILIEIYAISCSSPVSE